MVAGTVVTVAGIVNKRVHGALRLILSRYRWAHVATD